MGTCRDKQVPVKDPLIPSRGTDMARLTRMILVLGAEHQDRRGPDAQRNRLSMFGSAVAETLLRTMPGVAI